MEILDVQNTGLKYTFKVHFPVHLVTERIEGELSKKTKSVKIAGFRPGKAPTHIIKQRYYEDAKSSTINELIQQAIKDIITERELKLSSRAELTDLSFEDDKGLGFTVEFHTLPKIESVDYSKINLEKLAVEPTEKDIQESIDRMAKNFATETKKIAKARAVKEEDELLIDVKALVDGAEVPELAESDVKFYESTYCMISGAVNAFVDQKPGFMAEFTSYPRKRPEGIDLKNKDVTYQLTLKEIHERVMPEVNDEFAKKYGFENVAALKEQIVKHLKDEYARLSHVYLKRTLFDQLDKTISFDLPENLVKIEFDQIWTERKAEIERSKEEIDLAKEEETYQKLAARRVKLGLLLNEVSTSQNLTVSQDDLNKAVGEQLKRIPGREKEFIDLLSKNPDMIENIKAPIIEEKAIGYILELAKVTEKPVALEELLKAIDQV